MAGLARRNRQIPWWRRRLAWGAALAIALGALSLATDVGGTPLRLGATMAISGIVLALAVDFYFRLEEVAEHQAAMVAELLEAQAKSTETLESFVSYAEASPSCRAFLNEVAKDWKRVDDRNSVFLRWIMDDIQQEFRAQIHTIANGQATVDRRSRHYLRSISLHEFAEIWSLSASNPEYWRTQHGRRYLENQRSAIANGTHISRFLVLPQSEIDDHLDVVRDQIDAGVDLAIIVRDEVTYKEDQESLLNDRVIVTDRAGVTGTFRAADNFDVFTTDEVQVRDTEDVLRELKVYARQPAEVYPGLNRVPES